MRRRSFHVVAPLLALITVFAVQPDPVVAQGCQECVELRKRPDRCDFCSAGPECFQDCRHDVIGNCYVQGSNCPGFAFLEGAQPAAAFRLAGGTVLPVSDKVSVHVNCSGQVLGIVEEFSEGRRYLERTELSAQWLRKEEARLRRVVRRA